jgi:photosystem II stability/assembly factor-like uncharacterized protein
MNKTKILGLFASALFLTGCSFVSSSTDGGVFRSDDGGKSFAQKVTIDDKTKIGSVDVLSLAVNPQNGNEVYIGTVSSGIFKTTDAGETWQVLKVSTNVATKVYALAVDPINSNTAYAAAIVDGRGKILKSTDAGTNWKEIYTEPSSGSFVLALAVDPAGSGKIFGGTTEGQIIFSDNSGDTWKNMFKAQVAVFKIAIDSMNSGLAYFAVSQGGLLRTRDGGKIFENLSEKSNLSNQQQFGNPTAITVDPNRTNWVYAGTTTGLFRSKNGGDDWEAVKVLSNSQANVIREIAINSQNSDEIVYGAAQTFYKSVDGGQSWSTTQLGGSRTAEAVAYNRQNPGVIYVGMNKR